MTNIVLLTGASGFIALHITNALLEKGYKVIGTVRSQEKGDNLVKKFTKLYPNAQLSYEIVKDISVKDSFDEVFQNHPELTDVIHSASPFSFGHGDKSFDEAFLDPAINGTLNALRAAKNYGSNIKTFVLTSSFASIIDNANLLSRPQSFIHTEAVWNPIQKKDLKDEVDAYYASKTLAEKAAWDFLKTENPKFTLTAITPPYVYGPQFFEDSLSNGSLNTSSEYINQALKTPVDDTDFHYQPSGLAVDVRDVAFLHVAPISNAKLAGERLFPSSGAFSGQYFLDVIHEKFPELNGKVGKGKGNPKETAKYHDEKLPKFDNSKTLELVGLKKWIPTEKSVYDTAKQILDYNGNK